MTWKESYLLQAVGGVVVGLAALCGAGVGAIIIAVTGALARLAESER